MKPRVPVRHLSSASLKLREVMKSHYLSLPEQKQEYALSSRSGPEVDLSLFGSPFINMRSFDFLGLGSHPEVVLAAESTLLSHGFGLSSGRIICGTQDIHKKLEQELADFHCSEDAMIYPNGYDANVGAFEALLSE